MRFLSAARLRKSPTSHLTQNLDQGVMALLWSWLGWDAPTGTGSLQRCAENRPPPSYVMNNYLLPIMLCLQYGHLMMEAKQMDLNLVNMRLMERFLPQKSPILHITDLFFLLLLIFWSQLPGSHLGLYWCGLDPFLPGQWPRCSPVPYHTLYSTQ